MLNRITAVYIVIDKIFIRCMFQLVGLIIVFYRLTSMRWYTQLKGIIMILRNIKIYNTI